MPTGSFARGALADLTERDLVRMLELDESLFVEHKSDIGKESSYQLAKSIASFANTLGGWVLIGVRNRKPQLTDSSWATDGAPTLADTVRDRLRTAIDPLPAFETRLMRLPKTAAPVGIVRVYESSDTPHVVLDSGAVYVREGAGDTNVNKADRPSTEGRRKQRYEAAPIRSRAQLVELAQRGEVAAARARALMDPDRQPPLLRERLGLAIGGVRVQPLFTPDIAGCVVVRLAPYTLPTRFRSWATTAEGAAAAIGAAEQLAACNGMDNDRADPHVAGVSVTAHIANGVHHRDSLGLGLSAQARIAIDAAGVVGAALHLDGPKEAGLRRPLGVFDLAELLIAPVIRAAAQALEQGEFLGRALCQIELLSLGNVVRVESSGKAEQYVPADTDLTLPASPEAITVAARIASTALGRSAGLRTYTERPEAH